MCFQADQAVSQLRDVSCTYSWYLQLSEVVEVKEHGLKHFFFKEKALGPGFR